MHPKIRRNRLVALSAILFSISAPLLASDSPAVPVEIRKMDGVIQNLKEETLEFNRQATLNERAILYPDATRVTLYVGVRANRFLIQSVNVSLDGGEPFRYEFADKNARSLINSGGLHTLSVQNLEVGNHKLRAEFTGQFEGAAANAAPVTGVTEYVFTKNRKPLELEISVNNGPSSKPALVVTSWNNAAFNAAETPPPSITVTPSTRKRPK